jgi:Zn-dependent protease with chaperone function
MTGATSYFDGRTTSRHPVSLEFTTTGLALTQNGQDLARWAYADIRREDADDGVMRIASTSAPELARVEVSDKALIAEIERRCPALLARDGIERRSTRRIVFWSMAAALSLMFITMWLMPHIAAEIAPLIPRSLEKRIGDAVYKQALALLDAQGTCDTGGSSGAPMQALEVLATKLRNANGLDADGLKLGVINSRTPNAFALPGGRIIILNGILQASQTADEIAGALAHEMGHLAHHDGMKTLVESGGMGFVLGTVLGDFAGATALLFASKTIVQASFSRDVESAADSYAVDTMRTLGRSPVPLGDLLTRLTGSPSGGSLPSLLDSHPATPDRLAAMRAASIVTTGAPILTDDQFAALKRRCGG